MTTTGTALASRVRDIPLADIRTNPDQPRQLFAKDALDELAASIRRFGILQPIVVRPLDGTHEIVAGERRYRAALSIPLDTAPCVVLETTTDEEAFILSTTENVNREDMTPIEEAKAYSRVMGMGRDVAEVAQLFGKEQSVIQWRVDLLRLDPTLQHLAATGQLSASLGWYLSKLSIDGQREVMRKVLDGSFASDHEAQAYAQTVEKREQHPDLFNGGGLFEGMDELREARARTARSEVKTTWEKALACVNLLGTFQQYDASMLADGLTGDELDRMRGEALALEKQARMLKLLFAKAAAFRGPGGTDE